MATQRPYPCATEWPRRPVFGGPPGPLLRLGRRKVLDVFDPFQVVVQLTDDASRVGRQQDRHAVSRPFSDLGRRDALVEPRRKACVA